MKKFLCVLTLCLSTLLPCLADEGMWLLPMLEKMNAGMMRDLGCRLSPEQIYSINHSSLKDAVVQFGGGCTAEIISGKGLLVTNHHCGYESIQKLSTPAYNYLEDGYWAKNMSGEIPVPGLTVTFLERMTDVTDIILKADKDGNVRETAEEIIDKAQAECPECEVSIVDFYNSNIYYLVIYKVYRDIRFVGAPPAAMGKFGGDTDNWMWPRQTCDFSMFRVYAGPDNQPADYSPDNIPFKPRQFLKISLKGYEEGDFAMVMGYPGRTQRFNTAAQLQNMEELHDISVAARGIRQEIIWKAMRADRTVGLQYADKYASSSNGWKKWIGEKESFRKLGVIGRQLGKEHSFMNWAGRNSARKLRYGSAIENIKKYTLQRSEPLKAYYLLYETIGMIEASEFAFTFLMESVKDSSDCFSATKDEIATLYKDYNAPLDKQIAAAMLKHYRQNANSEDLIELPGRDFLTMDIDAYVDTLFATSSFTSEEGMRRIDSREKAADDPACILYAAMYRMMRELALYINQSADSLAAAQSAYTAGLLEMNRGKASYPDANFTMRLTYGSVLPYSPKDGVLYKHYTTLAGVLEKEDPDNYEFRVPEGIKELCRKGDYGDYAMKNGEMPACFLTNCDITGGNSGSPVMDADGNLIGLAFDGNWESMRSDVIFEPVLQRCICVDIRYVLWLMDKYGGAGWLRKEMSIVK